MYTVILTSFVLLMLLYFYLHWLRPWQLRWGATDEEVERSMPGDEICLKPNFNATRAVTINTSPEKIWPWIMQIGFRRAGWYSYDWIDNLGRPSAQHIIPELQNLEEGDRIWMSRWTYNVVKEIVPNQYMLWTGGDSQATQGTWLWALYPIDNNRTRLVTRLRGYYPWRSPWFLLFLLMDVGDIVMMRKCMLGIKRRAENEWPQRLVDSQRTA